MQSPAFLSVGGFLGEEVIVGAPTPGSGWEWGDMGRQTNPLRMRGVSQALALQVSFVFVFLTVALYTTLPLRLEEFCEPCVSLALVLFLSGQLKRP